MSEVPATLLKRLQRIEPTATFTFSSPLVTSSSGSTYYAKVGRPSEAEQYNAEVESLNAIDLAAPGLAPRVFASGVWDDDSGSSGIPYFISEYKHLNPLSKPAAERMGERLARELHAHKSTNGFGFHVPTFCGATRLQNGWYTTWEECYSTMIGDLLYGLKRRGNPALYEKGEEVRKR